MINNTKNASKTQELKLMYRWNRDFGFVVAAAPTNEDDDIVLVGLAVVVTCRGGGEYDL